MLEATKIIKTLQDRGFHALLVGGCVRDQLMGVSPKDYDIVTSATPDGVEFIFENTLPVGKQFGVVIVNNDYEVATFREDNYLLSELSVELLDHNKYSLEELVEKDSAKRDLTMNAIYYDPISFMTYDPQNGQADIDNHVIRFVGDALERVKEDPIRLLRFHRFGAQYAHMDQHYADWDDLEGVGYLLHQVSNERIFTEVTKVLLHVHKLGYGDFRAFCKVLAYVLPEILYMEEIEQSLIHHPEGQVLKHTFNALKALRIKTPITVWATLLHDVGKATSTKVIDGLITAHGHENDGAIIAESILKKLKCSNAFIEEVVYIVENHMRIKWANNMRKGKVIKLIDHKYYLMLKEVSTADSMGSTGKLDWLEWITDFEINNKDRKPSINNRLVTGKDLIELGLTPGKGFSELLEEAQLLQLENKDLTKDQIIDIMNIRSK